MSLSFRLDVAPAGPVRTAVVAPHLVGEAGALACSPALASVAGTGVAAALVAGALALVALSLRRALGAGARGELAVDADGRASWRDEGAGRPSPLAPLRWQAIGPLVCVEGDCDGRRVSLLARVDAVDDTERGHVMAWLRWLDRGGARRAAR